ncbi:MAG: hypothetical protein IPL87_05305 [Candidatus Moraniibacteriota bacterium]|nr:MAG: hypothetical protein IPL87_05305 [Candidatus Moranbacteria bacterium]
MRYSYDLESFYRAYGNFSYSQALLIFFAYVIVDALFAKYTIDVSHLNEYKAAFTGMLTHVLLAFGVINYTQNWLYILPLILGSWIGTFLMIKREKSLCSRISK